MVSSEELQLIYSAGKEALIKVCRIIRCLRRQNYYKAMQLSKRLLNLLPDQIAQITNAADTLNQDEQWFTTEYLISVFQGIADAQQQKDYVLLADLYEIQLKGFYTKLMECFVAMGVLAGGSMEDRNGTGCRFDLEYTSSGYPTVAVTNAAGRRYFHSNTMVMEEADLLAQSWYSVEKTSYVIYGLGLGYHVLALASLSEYIQITVYENSSMMYELAMEYGVGKQLSEYNNITIIQREDAAEIVLNTIQHSLKDTKFAIHYPSLTLIGNTHVQEELENYFIEFSSIDEQLPALIGNFDKNILQYDQSVDVLKEKFSGRQIFLIGGGPSLDKNMEQLRYRKPDSIVIAAGTVYKKLMAALIVPDYVIITDANAQTLIQMEQMTNNQIPLMFLSTCYYKIPQCAAGKKYLICQQGFSRAEEYAKSKGFRTYQTGGSVITTALDVSLSLGAKSVVFVGVDLAFTGGKDHADGTAFQSTAASEEGRLVCDVNGAMVRTGRNLDIYRRWIERRIENIKDIEIIDATEGGAKIAGTKLKKLSELVEPHEPVTKQNICAECSTKQPAVKKKIILIKGSSQYDAMRIYIDELSAAFMDCGFDTVILDQHSDNAEAEFYDILKRNDYKFIFSCNGMMLGKSIRKLTDALFVTWLFDHPVYHMERLKEADEKTVILTCDRYNRDYIRTHFPNVMAVEFVPLSGSFTSNIKPYQERSIELLFTGSNLMPEQVYQRICGLPPVLKQTADAMIEVLKADPALTLEQSLDVVLNQRNLNLSSEQTLQVLFDLKDVGRYIRGYYRNQVIETIVQSGLPIHVFGNGWDQEPFMSRKNFIHHDGYGADSLKVLGDSKISLNVMPWFKAGTQERIVSAMLCGAVALTDPSDYLREQFNGKDAIVFYELKQLEQLPQQIHSLLEHQMDSAEIACRGYEFAWQSQTWKHRGREIIEIIKRVK